MTDVVSGLDRLAGSPHRATAKPTISLAPGRRSAARRFLQIVPEAAGRHLPVLRFALVNVAALGLLAGAYMEGWVTGIVRADESRLSLVIAAAFVVGLVLSAIRVFTTSRALNALADDRPLDQAPPDVRRYLMRVRAQMAHSRSAPSDWLRHELFGRIEAIPQIANVLVLLGLIGTVIGFIMALSGISANVAADVGQVAPMITQLIVGMSVALYTTLVGAVLHIWLIVDYRLLVAVTAKLANRIVELGERHERA